MTISGSLRALKPIVKGGQQVRRLATIEATTSSASSTQTVHHSNTISFASPESDFTAPTKGKILASPPSSSSSTTHHSNTINFASPESDFTSPTKEWILKPQQDPNNKWSQSIKFASAESDFTSSNEFDQELQIEWSGTMSYATPESDYTSNTVEFQLMGGRRQEEGEEQATIQAKKMKEDFINHIVKDSHQRDTMAYSLSFASAENDFINPTFVNLLDETMKKQLQHVSTTNSSTVTQDHHHLQASSSSSPTTTVPTNLSSFVNSREVLDPSTTTSSQKTTTKTTMTTLLEEEQHIQELDAITATLKAQDELAHETPLPTNLATATIPNDPRAIVVTEATMPFRIVSVNSSWEDLCGYTANECYHETLACLQGPETNKSAVTALMSQLLKGEEAGTLLTNYDKSGRKFHNRLRVGPLKNDKDEITHFVGVLKEVTEDGESFASSSSSAGKKMVA